MFPLWKRAIVVTIVGAALLGAALATAQLRTQPPIVRFVGVFHPFNEKAAGNLNTLTLSYKEQQWLFKVDQVRVMGGRDTGTMILSRIFPPRLSLSGPSQLMEPLGKPETLGKRWMLEGMLYLKHRRYYVAMVQEEATTDVKQ